MSLWWVKRMERGARKRKNEYGRERGDVGDGRMSERGRDAM